MNASGTDIKFVWSVSHIVNGGPGPAVVIGNTSGVAHTFDGLGDFVVTVNVSNLISSESSSATVHVLEKLTGLNVTIAPTVLVTAQGKVAVTSELTVGVWHVCRGCA